MINFYWVTSAQIAYRIINYCATIKNHIFKEY